MSDVRRLLADFLTTLFGAGLFRLPFLAPLLAGSFHHSRFLAAFFTPSRGYLFAANFFNGCLFRRSFFWLGRRFPWGPLFSCSLSFRAAATARGKRIWKQPSSSGFFWRRRLLARGFVFWIPRRSRCERRCSGSFSFVPGPRPSFFVFIVSVLTRQPELHIYCASS